MNIHILYEPPKLIPLSMYMKLEKCFLKEKTYWLNVIIQEIKIISKEIKLFLKTGLKLKQDM